MKTTYPFFAVVFAGILLSTLAYADITINYDTHISGDIIANPFSITYSTLSSNNVQAEADANLPAGYQIGAFFFNVDPSNVSVPNSTPDWGNLFSTTPGSGMTGSYTFKTTASSDAGWILNASGFINIINNAGPLTPSDFLVRNSNGYLGEVQILDGHGHPVSVYATNRIVTATPELSTYLLLAGLLGLTALAYRRRQIC